MGSNINPDEENEDKIGIIPRVIERIIKNI